MAETSKVVAKKRDRAGKGGARSSRREGLIPAVIYGDKQPPLMIAVEPKSIESELHHEGFFNHRLNIDVEGTSVEVLPRDVQVDPVTDKPLHLDFLRIGPESVITVKVPVHFKNEGQSPGIKRGGVLNVVLHEITVRTKANAIPEFFEVDLAGLEIGHSVHLSALKVPDGVRVVSREKNPTVASVAAATVVREAAAAAAAEAAAAALAPPPVEGAAVPGAPGAPGTPGAAPGAPGAAPAAGAPGAAPAAGAAPGAAPAAAGSKPAAPAAGGRPAPAKK
jgi:large subunit ribosomal protein L25